MPERVVTVWYFFRNGCRMEEWSDFSPGAYRPIRLWVPAHAEPRTYFTVCNVDTD